SAHRISAYLIPLYSTASTLVLIASSRPAPRASLAQLEAEHRALARRVVRWVLDRGGGIEVPARPHVEELALRARRPVAPLPAVRQVPEHRLRGPDGAEGLDQPVHAGGVHLLEP